MRAKNRSTCIDAHEHLFCECILFGALTCLAGTWQQCGLALTMPIAHTRAHTHAMKIFKIHALGVYIGGCFDVSETSHVLVEAHVHCSVSRNTKGRNGAGGGGSNPLGFLVC